MNEYVHGYNEKESLRLKDQAETLDQILHHDSLWEEGSLLLEAGCGVGAQTRIIAPKNPYSKFISIDISKESVSEAERVCGELNIGNVTFRQADIFDLPFEDNYFDNIFICFVLEHLSNSVAAFDEIKRVLKPGGSVTVIEGDHGSAYFSPDSEFARKAIKCQVILQSRNGGDANIGRRLFPLLTEAGLKEISVSPRMVYVDDSKPELINGFTKNTFTAMIEGIADEAVKEGLISEQEMKKGIEDLYKTAGRGGTFCYTFFKARGIL